MRNAILLLVYLVVIAAVIGIAWRLIRRVAIAEQEDATVLPAEEADRRSGQAQER